MALSVQESGEKSLTFAREASQLIEQRNLAGAKGALVKAGIGVVKHMQEIAYLLERYTAVQEYYMREENSLIAKINSVHSRELSAKSQKSSEEAKLRLERDELRRHESNLSSARDRYNNANRKRAENKTASIATGIAAGILTVFSFGTAAPITAPLAAGAVAGTIAFDRAADSAKDDMARCESEIRDSKRKISSSESTVSSLSSTIAQLNSDVRCYEADRSRLQNEKGRIKEVIVFLNDAKMYGNQYTITAEACSQRTALATNMVAKAETRGYSLFDSQGTKRVLSSFKEAWDAFEEMNANGTSYNFKMKFSCSQCSCSCDEFPHVSSSQLICTNCKDLL